MHFFQASLHSLLTIITVLSIFHFLFSADATTHYQQEQQRLQKRVRRDFINIFSDRNDNKQYQTGNNSPMIQTGTDAKTIPPKDLSDILGEHTGRLVEGATDVVLTPVTWLTNIQKYWPLYLVCFTIILGLLTFCYFSFQYKLAHLFSNNGNNEPLALVNFLRQQQLLSPLRAAD